MHLNFGNLIPRVLRSPRGVGKMWVLIMGRMISVRVGLKVLTRVVYHKFLKSVGEV
jgi:hypothetical protein